MTRRMLVALNVIGGIAVLGSYAWGLGQPAVAAGLWGHLPEGLRGLYTANMLLAALGYFPFTALLVLKSDDASFVREVGLGYRPTTLVLYAAVLVASALWLPLTAQMIADPTRGPTSLLWIVIRVDLAIVGLGALGMLVVCQRIARVRGGALAWAAVIGALPFAVLDALIWPYYWFA